MPRRCTSTSWTTQTGPRLQRAGPAVRGSGVVLSIQDAMAGTVTIKGFRRPSPLCAFGHSGFESDPAQVTYDFSKYGTKPGNPRQRARNPFSPSTASSISSSSSDACSVSSPCFTPGRCHRRGERGRDAAGLVLAESRAARHDHRGQVRRAASASCSAALRRQPSLIGLLLLLLRGRSRLFAGGRPAGSWPSLVFAVLVLCRRLFIAGH